MNLRDAARVLGGEVKGGQIFAPGPHHSPADRSMAIRFDPAAPDGFIVNSYSGDDPLECKDFVRQRLGLEPFKASGSARDHRQHAERPAPQTDDGALVMPIPAYAPPAPAVHPSLGKPTARWAYRDANGSRLFEVLRFDPPGAGKAFLPLTLWRAADGSHRWRWKGATEPRPLYGLDRLAARPDTRVVICEGEKSADAAERLLPDCVAVTSPNGSKSAAKVDWSPLRGRHVTIWPDADAPGAAYAQTVTELALATGAASIAIVAPPDGVVEGWDLADAEDERCNSEWVRELVAEATPYLSTKAASPSSADWPTPRPIESSLPGR